MPRRVGALRPAEIASAGVSAVLAVGAVSVAALMPHLGAVQLPAVVPFAGVGLRDRVRAVLAAGFLSLLVI